MLQSGWATRPGLTGPGTRGAAASAAALVLHSIAPAARLVASLGLVIAAGLAPAGRAVAGAPPAPDVRADAVVRSLCDAMGGQARWSAVPYLRFDFVVLRDGKEVGRRAHWWDKAHSRCRVEWKEKDGPAVSAVVNLIDRSGKSCTNGRADTDTLLTKHVQEAYELWVNDTYWLVMPFKLHDPGAHYRFDRSERNPGAAYDVLSLSFDPDVGLTPKDHYWLFINEKTHLLDRWEFLLQGEKPPPAAATWVDWKPVGPLRLATRRKIEKRPIVLQMENLAAPAAVDEALFTNPRPRG